MESKFLKNETNSLVAVDNNPMRFCISLTHIKYTLHPMYTWTKHTNIIANIKWFNKTSPI